MKIGGNANIFLEAWNCRKPSEGLENDFCAEKLPKGKSWGNQTTCYSIEGEFIPRDYYCCHLTKGKQRQRTTVKKTINKFEGILFLSQRCDWLRVVCFTNYERKKDRSAIINQVIQHWGDVQGKSAEAAE